MRRSKKISNNPKTLACRITHFVFDAGLIGDNTWMYSGCRDRSWFGILRYIHATCTFYVIKVAPLTRATPITSKKPASFSRDCSQNVRRPVLGRITAVRSIKAKLFAALLALFAALFVVASVGWYASQVANNGLETVF